MKKLLTFVLSIFIVISLVGCQDNNIDTTPGGDTGSESANLPSDTVFSGYYSPLTGHLNGTFRETINEILENTHTVKGSYKQAWTILQESDEYDENNIRCFYTGQPILKAARVGSNTTSSSIEWNREHVWAKSHGFDNASYTAYSDCHHLRACEEKINSSRGNLPFDEVTGGSSDSYGNKWNKTAFEPMDSVKGDVARIMFYMVVRYDSAALDLELEDSLTSTSSKLPFLGKLSTLIKWHYEDPVDEIEQKRNEVVYSYQKNRNPFIDYPDLVEYLYPDYV